MHFDQNNLPCIPKSNIFVVNDFEQGASLLAESFFDERIDSRRDDIIERQIDNKGSFIF